MKKLFELMNEGTEMMQLHYFTILSKQLKEFNIMLHWKNTGTSLDMSRQNPSITYRGKTFPLRISMSGNSMKVEDIIESYSTSVPIFAKKLDIALQNKR